MLNKLYSSLLFFSGFPEGWKIDIGRSIDDFVNYISIKYAAIFDAIRTFGIWIINGINGFLLFIPWWLFIIIIVALSYFATKKIFLSLLYGGLIFLIGVFGLWVELMQTLSIVIAAVVLAVALGFPIGILISLSPKVGKVLRPILDAMQTLPSFVYLVPAVILFDTGKLPALIATTIYAIVPMIRMTNHGISIVDKEVVEAAKAFGSTTMQTLIKVQIPQALPTIMTGVNQTIMMSMSMVVTCSLIGANGLGIEILKATTRVEVGKSLLPGLSIVFIAIILDRITQGIAKRSEAKHDERN